jgi:Leucine-rich repeat (LRR) protein
MEVCTDGEVELKEDVQAAALLLQRLRVEYIQGSDSDQLRGLGWLLQTCTRLVEVDISCAVMFSNTPADHINQHWLLSYPYSTSLGTAAVQPARLVRWTSAGVPFDLVTRWAAQLGPGCCFTQLVMDRCSQEGGAVDLTALKGLQHLALTGSSMYKPPVGLGSMGSSLTQLQLQLGQEGVEALPPLTNLQHLSLYSSLSALPNSISSLKQLRRLDIMNTSISELPADLGVWLPRLEQLGAKGCALSTVPTSLTTLKGLDLSYNRQLALVLPTTLSTLRELKVRRAKYTSVVGLSSLVCVEDLDVVESVVLGSSLSVLQPLSCLRSLDMEEVQGLDPGSYTVIGALRQLTCLHMGGGLSGARCPTPECNAALASTQPPPGLLQLDIRGADLASTPALGTWLAQLTVLTQLCMEYCCVAPGDELHYLTASLQDLDISTMPLQGSPEEHNMEQLPLGLTRLTSLTRLAVRGFDDMSRGWDDLKQLPEWLSVLQSLEVLDLRGTGVTTQQEVLGHMPNLRWVALDQQVSLSKVGGSATHLVFGHNSRWDDY